MIEDNDKLYRFHLLDDTPRKFNLNKDCFDELVRRSWDVFREQQLNTFSPMARQPIIMSGVVRNELHLPPTEP